MAYYIYNGIKLPALPSGLNEFNYILRSGDFYYLASATAEEKTINAYGAIRVSSSEGIFYTFSDGAWVENSNDNAIGYVVWSNTDVYDSTGTLYLAATDPIPVGKPITDPLSFAMGWQLGCRLRAQRMVKKPIGYSYNGVVLPELPELLYQYAVIEYAEVDSLVKGGRVARLICSSEPIVYTASGILQGYNLTGDVSYYGWANDEFVWEWSLGMNVPDAPYDEWVKMGEDHFGETTFVVEKVSAASPKWANHDLYWITSSINQVLVSASEPIPVYE